MLVVATLAQSLTNLLSWKEAYNRSRDGEENKKQYGEINRNPILVRVKDQTEISDRQTAASPAAWPLFKHPCSPRGVKAGKLTA